MLDEAFALVASTPAAWTSSSSNEAVDELALTLKRKVWERAKVSEEATLKEAFKAFSSDRTGRVTFLQFVRIVERFGMPPADDGRRVIGGMCAAHSHDGPRSC